MDFSQLSQPNQSAKQSFQKGLAASYYSQLSPSPIVFGNDIESPSVYDRYATSPEELLDPEKLRDLRGTQQSAWAKVGSGLGKFGVLTATTTADGVLGTLVGLGNMVYGNQDESAMQRFISNPFTKVMDSVNKWSEEAMPNYYTNEEEQMKWWNKLGTANFWSDGVLKNMGFAAGALLSGVLTAGAADAALGGKAVATRLAKGILANSEQAGKIAAKYGLKTEEELVNALYSRAISVTDLAENLSKDAKFLRNKGLGMQMFGSVMGAQGEARFESLNTYDTVKNKLIAEELEKNGLTDPSQLDEATQNRIEQASKAASNADFWMNMGILSATNFIEFGKTIGGGFKTQKFVNDFKLNKDAAGRITGAVLDKPTTKVGKSLYGTTKFLERSAKVLKNPLAEGTEEQLQYLAQNASEDYYSRKFDPDGNKEVHSFMESLGEGFKKAYGTSEGWENFVLGALTTVLGIPSFKANRKWLTGGVFDQYGELAKRDKYTNEVIGQLNTKIQSKEFQNYYGALVRNASLEGDKQKAMEANDEHTWRNLDDEQFINMTDLMIKAGKYEDWVEHLTALGQADPTEVRKLYEVTKDQDGKELQTPIAGFSDKTDEELKKYLTERSQKLLKQAEAYKKIRTDIDYKFGNKIDDTLKESLAYNLATVGQVEERENQVIQQLQGKGLMDGRSYKEILREQTSLKLLDTNLNNLRKSRKEVNRLKATAQTQLTKIDKLGLDIAAEQSKDKRTKWTAQKKEAEETLREINSRIASLEKTQEEKLQEAHNNTKVLADNIDSPYMSWDEFRQSASLLMDKVDNFEAEASRLKHTAPQHTDEINELLNDLALLNGRRQSALNQYLFAVKATRDKKAAGQFAETVNNVHNKIRERELTEKAKRFDFAAGINQKKQPNVVDSKGNQYSLFKKGDKYFTVNDKDEISEVTLNTEFAAEHELLKDKPVTPVTQASTEGSQTTSTEQKIKFTGNKATVNGRKVTYKDKEYVAIEFDSKRDKLFKVDEKGNLLSDFAFTAEKEAITYQSEPMEFTFQGEYSTYSQMYGITQLFYGDKSVKNRIESIWKEGAKEVKEEEESFEIEPTLWVNGEELYTNNPADARTINKIFDANPNIIQDILEAKKNGQSTVKVGKYNVGIPFTPNKDAESPVSYSARVIKLDSKGNPITFKDKKGNTHFVLFKSFPVKDPEKLTQYKKYNGQWFAIYKTAEGKEHPVQVTRHYKDEDVTLYKLSKEEKILPAKNLKGYDSYISLRDLRKQVEKGKIQSVEVGELYTYTNSDGAEIKGYKVSIQKEGREFKETYFVPEGVMFTEVKSIFDSTTLFKFPITSYNSLKQLGKTVDREKVEYTRETDDPETVGVHEQPFDKEAKPKPVKGVLNYTTDEYIDDLGTLNNVLNDNPTTPEGKLKQSQARSQVFWSKNDIAGKKLALYTHEQLEVPFEGVYTVVTDDKGNPVGLDGQPISSILNEGLIQSVPLPNHTIVNVKNVDGKLVITTEDTGFIAIAKNDRIITASVAATQKADLENIINDYKKEYAQLQELAKNNATVDITLKLHGFPVMVNGEINPTQKTRETLNGKNVNFEVATSTKSTLKGYPVTLNPGRVYAMDQDSGNIIELEPNRITDTEAEAVVSLIEQQVKNAKVENGKLVLDNTVSAVTMTPDEATGELTEKSVPVQLFDFIRGIVYIQDRDNLTKIAKDLYRQKVAEIRALWEEVQEGTLPVQTFNEAKARAEEEITAAGQINKNSKTQFYYETNSEGELMRNSIVIAGKSYILAVQNGENLELNPEVKQALRNFLSSRITNFSAKGVRENSMLTVPVEVREDGTVVVEQKATLDRLQDNTTVVPSVMDGAFMRGGQKLQFSNNNEPKQGGINLENLAQDFQPGEFQINPDALDKDKLAGMLNRFNATLEGQEGSQEDLAAQFSGGNQTEDSGVPEDVRQTLSAFLTGNSTPDTAPFRLAVDDMRVRERENIPAMQAWLDKTFGGKVKFENVNELIAGRAYGQFRDAAIYIYNNAEVGTTFHEAFHAVTELFLTPKQRQALITEAKNDKRLAGRIAQAKRLYGDKSEETIILEALSEEFRDFMLDEGNSVFKKTPVRKNLFQRILDFIREVILGKTVTIEEVFNHIDKRVYRSRPKRIMSSSEVFDDRFPGKSQTYTKNILDGLNYHFFQRLFQEKNTKGESTLFTLFSKSADRDITIPAKIREAYRYAQAKILEAADNFMKSSKASGISENTRELLQNTARELYFAVNHWDKAVKLHKDYLKKFNLEINYDEENYQGETPEDMRNGGRSDFNKNSLTISAKANSSRLVKMLIATIPNMNQGKLAINNLGLPVSIDYGKNFNLLMNKLAGHTSLGTMVDILEKLKDVPEASWADFLLNRLRVRGEEPHKNWKFEDVDLITKFVQSFAKNNNHFGTLIVNEKGDEVLVDSNTTSMIHKVESKWQNELLYSATKGNSFLTRDNNGRIVYNSAELKKLPYNDKQVKEFPSQVIGFLNALGIKLSVDSITPDNYADIVKRTNHMRSTILARNNYPVVFSNVADNVLTTDVATLISYEAQNPRSLDTIENSHFNLNGDLVYDNTLFGFVTGVISRLKDFRNEYLKNNPAPTEENYGNFLAVLRESFPFYNDPYLNNSLLLKDFFLTGNLDMVYIEGSREGEYGDGVSFSELKTGDRLRAWFNAYKRGQYVMSRPADNSQERFFVHGQLLTKNTTFFKEYLIDELNNRKEIFKDTATWKYTDKNLYNGIALDIIKKGITLSQLEKKEDAVSYFNAHVKEYIEGKITIEEFYEDSRTKNLISTGYNTWIENEVNETINLLKTHRLIEVDNEGNITNNSLQIKDSRGNIITEFKGKDREHFTDEIRTWVKSHLISQVEQTKLFLGDTMFSKTVVDKFKRNNANVSTKKIVVSEPKESPYEQWILQNLKRVDQSTLYDSFRPEGQNKRVVRTLVLDDVQAKNLQKELDHLPAYKDMTEGDGQSYISPDERRELYFRTGDWSMEAEDLYQYSMQKYFRYKIEKGEFTEEQFKEVFGREWDGRIINPLSGKEVKKENLLVKINSDKVQYCGPLAEKGYKPAMYKTSTIEINPFLFMNESLTEVVFPNMEKLLDTMIQRQVGVISHFSAVKGYTSKVDKNNKFYTEDGKMNDLTMAVTQDTYSEFWGIQLDTGFDSHHETVTGTQMMKQFWNGLYDSGEIMEEYKDLIPLKDHFDEINAERIALGQKKLISDLGLKKVGNAYVFSGETEDLERYKKFIGKLRDEAIKRNMPDNLIDNLNYLEKGLGVEPLLNRNKIENILFSIADRTTITQKMLGKPSYQVASTLLEKNGVRQTTTENGKTVFTSNELKFYTTDGKNPTTRMQIYLPSIYRGVVSTDLITDKKLLELIGFRIPTQGPNSIEAIEIAGFLNPELGDIVVVPTEIVAKAGSDFDIDKLYIYLINTYTGVEGLKSVTSDLSYTAYKADAELAVKKQFDRIVKGSVKEHHFLRELYNEISNDPFYQNYQTREILDVIYEKLDEKISQNNFQSALASRVKDILKQTETKEGIKLGKILSEDQFRKAQIENEMVEIMGQILLHPANYKNLVTPIASENLDAVRKTINNKRGVVSESKYHSDFASIGFLNNISKQNMEGAGTIGIAALASTFHILAARYGFKVASKIPGDISTKINLPHNEKEGLINIGGAKNLDGKMIWEMFNEYITATVDNAKEPKLEDLNAGLATMNTVLYLVMAGVPVETVHYFMNQPIIREYIKNQEIFESQNAEANDIFKSTTYRLGLRGSAQEKKVLYTKRALGEVTSINPVEFNSSTLEKMIGKPFKNMSNGERAMQLQILDDFIRYQETAKWVANAIQGTTYDTRSYGKNLNETLYRLKQTELVLNSGVIINYDKALGVQKQDEKRVSDGSVTFLSPYRKALEDIKEIYEPMFLGLYNKEVMNEADKLLENYINFTKIGSERILKVMDSWKQDLITYLLTTKSYAYKGKNYSPMGTNKEPLFKGKDSLPNKIKTLQDAIAQGKRQDLADNSFLKGLQPIFNEGSPVHNLKFISKGFEKIEQDQFTDDWRQLYEQDNALGLELLKFVINQSGIGNSPINFINFAPADMYGDIATSIMSLLNVEGTEKLTPDELSGFTWQWRFHNASNNDIVPYKDRATDPSVHPVTKQKKLKPEYENYSRQTLLALKAKGINPYDVGFKFFDSEGNEIDQPGNNFKDLRNNSEYYDYKAGVIGVSPASKTIQNQQPELNWQTSDNTSSKPIVTKKECGG